MSGNSRRRPPRVSRRERADALAGQAGMVGARVRAFHAREVALYFAAVMAVALGSISRGRRHVRRRVAALWLLVPGGISVGVLCAPRAALGAHDALPRDQPSHRHADRRRAADDLQHSLPVVPRPPARPADGTVIFRSRSPATSAPRISLWPHARPWRAATPSRCCALCRMRRASQRPLSRRCCGRSDELQWPVAERISAGQRAPPPCGRGSRVRIVMSEPFPFEPFPVPR